MPKVELSTALPNPLVFMDWRDASKDFEGFSRALVTHYEDGKVVIVRQAPFQIDYDLLNQVAIPKGRKYKKNS